MARYGDAWEELGHIDYLLDDLARAVERGEVPRESYDAIAPRHLARRAQLVSQIEGARAGWQAAAQRSAMASAGAEANTPQPGQTPEASGPPARTVSGAPAAVPPRPQQPPAPASSPQRTPRPVHWTQVLAYTGAFLVVVAAAIFTVAVWETVSTTAKLGFLGAFTVAFYVAGVWAWRTGMHGGGVALAAVGAAMLLFDGWIAIDGYGLAGVWPWAVLLLVLSAVYWLTEVWMSGRFFGATGAAAQVGWWWLLGQGLGWTVAPRLAGIAAVAAVWAFVAGRTREREGFASLASVLRIAAPIAAVGAALGVLADIPIGPVRWVDVASAAIVAVALTSIADRQGTPWRGMAAFGSVPLLVALASMAGPDRSSWALVAAFAAVSLAAGAYGLLRGGVAYVAVALVAELGAWFALANVVGLEDHGTFALLGAVALTWFLAERLMTGEGAGQLAPEAAGGSVAAAAGGWLLLGWTTLASLATTNIVFNELAASRSAILAWWLLALWVAAGVLTRSPLAGGIALAVSAWAAVATTVAWVDPSWESPAHPLAVLLVVTVWRYARPLSALMRFEDVGPMMSRVFVVGVTVWCFGLAAFDFPDGSGQLAVIAALLAVFWIADAFSARRAWFLAGAGPSFAFASFLLVSSFAVGPMRDVIGPATLGAAATAALVAALAITVRAVMPHAGAWFAVPGTAAVTAALVVLAPEPSFVTAGFALLALAWGAGAVAARLLVLTVPAALSVTASVAALLAWGDVSPGISVSVLTLVSAAMLAPTLAARSGLPASLAAGGVVSAMGTALLGVASVAGLTAPGTWAHLSWWGAAAAMSWLGAALVIVAQAYRIEVAEYLGAAALLFAAWFVLGAVDTSVVAPYAAFAGVFIAAMSARWSSHAENRGVSPVVDWVAVAAFVGLPVLAALSTRVPADVWVNSLWAVGLALVAMAVGIVARVRAYLFGAVAGLVAVSVWRSFFVLVEFWWVVLGLIGVAMLVIALTWERQQVLLKRTGSRLQEMLGGWR